MPDENRFAGIADAVENEGDGSGAAGEENESSTAESDVAGGRSSDDDSIDGESPSGDASADDASTPDDPVAFEFDDTVQKSVYVRPETFEALEDAEALVDARLRTDHEVKNLTRREFFDAVFAEAADDTDRLVERILRMREK
ncbi:hypothetical protein [Halostella sp. PRR32]|uniref:hypothetical protein n=1 Tax=Halostella sp. PRR32 TaxID=3098147 RepID=UPI002B1D45A4|nr:hypothetical protein [Halostella sp. PRR32]